MNVAPGEQAGETKERAPISNLGPLFQKQTCCVLGDFAAVLIAPQRELNTVQ
jgi:hypothetical protein